MSKRQLTAIPATRSARSRKIREWTVVGAWVALACLGPLSFLMTARSNGQTPVVQSAEFPTRIVSFAEIVAEDFLAGRPTRMPAADDVDARFGFPNGEGTKVAYDAMTVLSVSNTVVPQRVGGSDQVSIVTFRVQFSDGRVMDLAVSVVDDPRGLPLLAATPSLRVPLLGADGSAAPIDYDGVPFSNPPSAAVIDAVGQWAKAFVADDRAQLKTIVNGIAGTTPPAGEYYGLGGFTISRSISVGDVVPSTNHSGFAYARVALGVTQEGGISALLSYDVLIGQYTGNNPRVVGWGAAGTGPLLVPFANNTGFTG